MTNQPEYNFTTDERKSRQQLANCTEYWQVSADSHPGLACTFLPLVFAESQTTVASLSIIKHPRYRLGTVGISG
jgi:hypothetical protein